MDAQIFRYYDNRDAYDNRYIDASEAPTGYMALPKSTIKTNENVCAHCDYRATCATTSRCFPCMGDKRKDRISVIFKFKF